LELVCRKKLEEFGEPWDAVSRGRSVEAWEARMLIKTWTIRTVLMRFQMGTGLHPFGYSLETVFCPYPEISSETELKSNFKTT